MTVNATEPRFDWYAGTVNEPLSVVLECLHDGLAVDETEEGPGMRGYDASRVLRSEGVTVARVFMSARADVHPHVQSSGDVAPATARLLKRALPHRLARADSCVDFYGPSEYDRLEAMLLEVAADRGVKVMAVGNIWSSADGRPTVYVGSSASEVRVRLYDKHAESEGAYPEHTYRLELQARPGKPERKEWAAHQSPSGIWGLSGWSGHLADRLGIEGEQPPSRSKRRGDLDSALDACASQYGRRFIESVRRHEGDLEAFALDLLARVPESQQRRVSTQLSA